MDTPSLVALIVGSLAGLSGLAALVKAGADLRQSRSVQQVNYSEHLHNTARSWVDYIDGKFSEVSRELETYKKHQAQRDRDLSVMVHEHGGWDEGIVRDWHTYTGSPYPTTPPPLVVPPFIYATPEDAAGTPPASTMAATAPA